MIDRPDVSSPLEHDTYARLQRDQLAIHVHGKEATDWLHRISSQEIRKLREGACRPNLMLDDHGKIIAMFDTVRTAEGFRLWVQSDPKDTVLERLAFYHFSEDVAWEVSADWQRILILGEHATTCLETILQNAVDDEFALGADMHATRAPHLGIPAWNVDVPASKRELILERLALPTLDDARFEVLRIERGLARWPDDLAHGVFPHEARMERAFDLDKGCYPGQETVARMDTYGGPQRKLYGFVCDGEPIPGTFQGTVHRDDQEVGQVTSAIHAPLRDRTIALGYLKKKAWVLDSEVLIRTPHGERPARVVDLPFPSTT
ncbi:MAG: hypothetical protein H6834_09200 [Planctomycetes bacterium]|nr:hypothetical protein [Planctomycetota bacterium]